jgi:hypothetical protein
LLIGAFARIVTVSSDWQTCWLRASGNLSGSETWADHG